MTMLKISLAIVCVISLANMVHVTLAQNSPQDYLNAHNAARARVGVGPMRWDAKVASYAQNYVNKLKGSCKLVHSGGPYGENLGWGSNDLSGTAAVNMWVAEKTKYDYNSNSCVGGECRHYTQVVWSNSVRLGCAKVRCNNGATIISCNYDPPGNYVNQRPYLRVLQELLGIYNA
ncbi:pathogenesis-related protein 1 [Fagus crenata]